MIQRYDLVCEYEANIGPLDDGDYVAYADHLAELTTERARADRAEAERDALRAEVELWKERAYQLSHA